MESGQPKVDSDNDEVSLRLKTFVENLDAEKTELANRLHEEQRYVGYFGCGIRYYCRSIASHFR